MKISLITPSRFRIAQLIAYLRGFEETTRGYDVESIVVADGCFETIDAAKASGSTILYRPIRQGAINSWNDGLRIARGDALIFGANDLVWHSGWLAATLKALETLPRKSGMVCFNDLSNWQTQHEMGTHFLLTRDCVRDVMGGCLAIPIYQHYYVDPEMNLRAQKAKCWTLAQDAIVEHCSFLNGKAADDESYSQARESFESDKILFHKRQAHGFPNDFEPIIK